MCSSTLSSYLLKNDTRSGAVRIWELAEITVKSKPTQCTFGRRMHDNLSAEPGLRLSWQPRCLHGLSRGSQEVRVQRRSWVKTGKTKASTSCVTHCGWFCTEGDWTYVALEFGLQCTWTAPWLKSKTGKKMEQGEELCTLYCIRCYWTPLCGRAHAGRKGIFLKEQVFF